MMVVIPVYERDGTRPWWKTISEKTDEVIIEQLAFDPNKLIRCISTELFKTKVVRLEFSDEKYTFYSPLHIDQIVKIINGTYSTARVAIV